MTSEYTDAEIAAMEAELPQMERQAAHNKTIGVCDGWLISRIDSHHHRLRTGEAW